MAEQLLLRNGDGDSEQLVRTGRQAQKRPNPVWLKPVPVGTVFETDSGVLTLEEEGFAAFDPISGHIWPVARTYVDLHYDFVDGEHIDSWAPDAPPA